MSGAVCAYRARQDCRAGGLFRRAGDIFEMPEAALTPGYLEKIGAHDSGQPAAEKAVVVRRSPSRSKAAIQNTGKPAPIPLEAQVNKADIGAAPATPVQEVTSADMISK